MKKFILVISTILTIITCTCNIFAEEEIIKEEQEEIKEEVTEEINENIEQLNNINNRLDSFGLTLNSIENGTNQILKSPIVDGEATVIGSNGNLKSYQYIRYFEEYYDEIYELWNESAIIYCQVYSGENDIYFVKREDITNETLYDDHYNWTRQNATVYIHTGDGNSKQQVGNGNFNYYFNNYQNSVVETRHQFYLKYTNSLDQILFDWHPLKIKVNNNTENIKINGLDYNEYYLYEPYQSVTLRWNNEEEEFSGWYTENNELISTNEVYTFNIENDWNIYVNYKNTETTNINLLTLEYSMFILIGYLFIKGALSYDR